MQDFKQTFERSLSGINYLVRLEVRQATLLKITAVELHTGQCWKIVQDKTQIENLTEKTGSFKSFEVFVTMLLNGIKQQSTSVELELHTYAQLEKIRAELRGDSNFTAGPAPPGSEKKRYMIMSYASGYDKVQYPLILTLDTNPDREILSEVIMHLKTEIESTRSQPSFNMTGGSRISSASASSSRAQGFFPRVEDSITEEFLKAKAENELLKTRLKSLRDSKSSGFYDVNSEQKEELLEELASTKRNKMAQMGRLQQLIGERQESLRKTMSELEIAKTELDSLSVDDFDLEEARSQLGEISHLLEEEEKTNKQRVHQNQRILDKVYEDLMQKKAAEKKVRLRANQLENQLQSVLKRLNIVMKSKGISPSKRGASLGPASKYRNSPGSYLNNNRLKTPPMKRPGYSSSPATGSVGKNGVRSSGYGRKNYSPGVRNYSPGYRNSSPSSALAAYQNRIQSSSSKKKISSRNQSPSQASRESLRNKGSPAPNSRLYNPARSGANRLYSPSGRPRLPGSNYSRPGAGQARAGAGGRMTNSQSYSNQRQSSNPRQNGPNIYDRLSAARQKNRGEGPMTQNLLKKQNKENSTSNIGIKNLTSQQQHSRNTEMSPQRKEEGEKKEAEMTKELIDKKLELIQSLLRQQKE